MNDSGEFDMAEKDRWNDVIWDWHYVLNHRYDKNQTNAKYNDDMKNPKANTLYITMDFKQNMVIGRQKTERNALYNVREARTVFGVYLSCRAGRFYVNHLSDCNSHTATFTVACMRQLFETQWVKNIIENNGIRHVVVWSDQGRHFMNCANLYFWLIELIYKYEWISTVTYNFFIAKHGKSLCDGHFGQLNYYYNIYVKTNDIGVHNTQQLATAILHGYNQAQRVRQFRNENLNHQAPLEEESIAEVRCVNFDLNADNQHQRDLLQSKEDAVHIQYALIWKDKISSFGCYKVVRDEIDDTDRGNYRGHKSDLRYHNLIGYGPGRVGVYALKTRFDFNMTYEQLSKELSHAQYRQSTGYKHKIFVAGFPYQSYPVDFKSVELSLGFAIVPKSRMITKGDELTPIEIDTLHSQHRNRCNLYSN